LVPIGPNPPDFMAEIMASTMADSAVLKRSGQGLAAREGMGHALPDGQPFGVAPPDLPRYALFGRGTVAWVADER
jgi:hypothetical protein